MSAAFDSRRALMSEDVLTISNDEGASVARAVEQPIPRHAALWVPLSGGT